MHRLDGTLVLKNQQLATMQEQLLVLQRRMADADGELLLLC